MSSGKMQTIWLEKYRPSNLDNVLGNPDIVDQFKQIVKDGSIPNMILSVRFKQLDKFDDLNLEINFLGATWMRKDKFYPVHC